LNASEPPHRHPSGLDPLLAPTRPAIPGSPPPGNRSIPPVAERLIQVLERLLDLNEETARITALYRTNQQREQLLAQRDAQGRLDRNVHRDRDATGFRREIE
jgi:hypothetical protein